MIKNVAKAVLFYGDVISDIFVVVSVGLGGTNFALRGTVAGSEDALLGTLRLERPEHLEAALAELLADFS
mgnify:CR=1 FL=1